MGLKQANYARFENTSSEKSFGNDSELEVTRTRLSVSSTVSSIGRGISKSLKGIVNLKKPLNVRSSSDHMENKLGQRRKILDPQGLFLQQWNKIFVLACIISMSLDPLFFYVPVFDKEGRFLDVDTHLMITACLLRSFMDIFYILHIIFQFRTGFIAPSSRVFGRGELVENPYTIAQRYLSTYFIVDILAILPLPQVVVVAIIPNKDPLIIKDVLKFVIFCQYIPRFFRIYPLYKEVTRTSGIFTERSWAGAAFNLFLYMLASHVAGALWYLFAIERKDKCWRDALCKMDDFGIFLDALQSNVVEITEFPKKFLYCFWWGLRGLSSLGQNFKTSTSVVEILFAIAISVLGLVLFSFLIGNMQKYLQSHTFRVEEMRVKRRDTELWMSHRMLPENLRERISRHERYKWQETRGVDEEFLLHTFPKDVRRDIKRHLSWGLLTRVPMFENMDEQLLDAMCDHLKPVLYTEQSCIVREGDPVDEMLFIMRGKIFTVSTNGGRSGFFNSFYLEAGDFCGEELLTWALDPNSSSTLPISTRTAKSVSDVEAFALMADDLKSVASQFRRLHSKKLQRIFRFHSQQWRLWAASCIQAAWRRYVRRKLGKCLREKEDRLESALANKDGASPSFVATIYASRFAANAPRALR